MADEATYTITKENGETGKSSRDYTGKATAVYANAEIYEGDFVGGVRQGKGKYTYANGDKYEGDFVANKKHGIGKLSYAGKPKEGDDEGKVVGKGDYYGHFENGRRHGEGLFTYPNKDIYSGWWKYGKKNGIGTYVFNDTGMKLTGEWSENQFIKGKWVFPNGTIYEGTFKNNKPEGPGRWLFKNENVLEGQYVQQVVSSEEEQPEGQQIKLEWLSNGNIYSAACEINALENL